MNTSASTSTTGQHLLVRGSTIGRFQVLQLVGKGGMYGNVIRISPPLNISRADLAHFMIHNVTNEATYKATIEISY